MVGYIIQLVGAFFVGVFCSVLVVAPKNALRYTPIISTSGWALYLACVDIWGISAPVSTYISGLLIAGLSHYFARKVHEPVTVFFIPGFFTLVPGGGMYRTALGFIQGDSAAGVQELGTTLFTALAIALAVFTADTFMNILNKQKFPKFIRKNKKRVKKMIE